MDDAERSALAIGAAVGVIERVAQLGEERQHHGDGHGLARIDRRTAKLVETHALEVLHGDEVAGVGTPEVMHVDDVRV